MNLYREGEFLVPQLERIARRNAPIKQGTMRATPNSVVVIKKLANRRSARDSADEIRELLALSLVK